jgi:hypothetical protein
MPIARAAHILLTGNDRWLLMAGDTRKIGRFHKEKECAGPETNRASVRSAQLARIIVAVGTILPLLFIYC